MVLLSQCWLFMRFFLKKTFYSFISSVFLFSFAHGSNNYRCVSFCNDNISTSSRMINHKDCQKIANCPLKYNCEDDNSVYEQPQKANVAIKSHIRNVRTLNNESSTLNNLKEKAFINHQGKQKLVGSDASFVHDVSMRTVQDVLIVENYNTMQFIGVDTPTNHESKYLSCA